MDLKTTKLYARQHIHDLYPPDKRGKGIICPICGNGSGSDGDGVTFVKPDSHVLYCFKCGFKGDVIKLKAQEMHCSYMDAAHAIAEHFGLACSSAPRRIFRKFSPIISKPVPDAQVDLSDFFNQAAKDLEKTDYFLKRGFSLDTCRHFNLGFVFAWSHPKVENAPKSPRLIIPTSNFSYLARDTRDKIPDYQQKFAKQKVGSVSLFNSDALDADFTFVVEGELDAISFYEIGFHAIALGSTANSEKFIHHVKARSSPPKFLILALDNDKAGKETALKLKPILDSLQLPNLLANNIYGEHKDANELLIADKDSLKQNASAAVDVAKKIAANSSSVAPVSTPNSSSSSNANAEDPALADAISLVNSVTDFNNSTVLQKNILAALALCKVYQPDSFATFRLKCKAGSVDLKLFDEQINELVKPIKKLKRRHDKDKEFQLNRELAQKRRLQRKQQQIADLQRISELRSLPDSPERDDEIISLISRNLERAKDHNPKGCASNFDLILNFDPYVGGCVGFDKSSNRMVIRRALPWRDPNDFRTGRTDAWSNSDDNSLWCYINRTYCGLDSFKNMTRAVDDYAKAHSFHPIQDYLNSLPKWDGVNRAETFFIDTLNVTDSAYARCVTLYWLTAAVSRIFHPGCKWDHALVVKGDQGIGKSSVFSKLAGKWFNDSIDSINGKDAIEQLQGSWIVEFSEMQATNRSANEAIKSFISRRVDKVRLPYMQRSEEYLRQTVFAGTTNSEEFLKDPTGGRRFFILIALAKDSEVKDRLAKIDQLYIDQLWAEVLFFYKELFKDGFDDTKLVPPPEVFDVAKQLQGDYTEGSELEGMIRAYLDILLPTNWRNCTMFECRNFIQSARPDPSAVDDEDDKDSSNHRTVGTVQRKVVSAVEIAYELFRVDNPGKERALLRQINEILARLDGWKRTTWKRCGVYGQQRVAFERIISADIAA